MCIYIYLSIHIYIYIHRLHTHTIAVCPTIELSLEEPSADSKALGHSAPEWMQPGHRVVAGLPLLRCSIGAGPSFVLVCPVDNEVTAAVSRSVYDQEHDHKLCCDRCLTVERL